MSLLHYIYVIFLSVLYISSAICNNDNGTEQFLETLEHKGSNESSSIYLCNDDAIKQLINQVELLSAASENLRLKLDKYILRLENELIQANTVLVDNIRRLLMGDQKSSYGSLINVLSDFTSKKNPTSCAEALEHGSLNGSYKLYLPDSGLKAFYVYCLHDPDNGTAWTVIQRRHNGSIDFFRNWQEYVLGFGNVYSEFFIGLDKLHAMTNSQLHELWIQMEDFDGEQRFAKYDSFAIGDNSEKYALNVLGSYSGDAGDSLKRHEGCKFSTKETEFCASKYMGAWWYQSCQDSNLNGKYYKGEISNTDFGKGINWKTWRGYQYSLKYVHMAIRPTNLV